MQKYVPSKAHRAKQNICHLVQIFFVFEILNQTNTIVCANNFGHSQPGLYVAIANAKIDTRVNSLIQRRTKCSTGVPWRRSEQALQVQASQLSTELTLPIAHCNAHTIGQLILCQMCRLREREIESEIRKTPEWFCVCPSPHCDT